MAFLDDFRERSRAMKVQTNVKAGGIWPNHNQTLVRRTAIETTQSDDKGDGISTNHNQTLVRKAS
jgi:hypothetical protein